ncbi:VanZ family protein [Blastococcus sp. LR1]|uniref:VanZ family protein n=1 Tax=Blastococcus sp. LR1 TaxID=2877000 RepID=UPI001CCFE2B4|nr:VanZ family protein [Blastococcus sp. LR1]MCA0144857.1 VanZ family protein [Blastococcus sp. LR1]
MSRRVAVVGLVAYLAVLASLTLGASPGAVFTAVAQQARTFEDLQWVRAGDVERTANVLVFVPVGLLVCFALPRVSRLWVWVLCVLLSLTVEGAQFVLPGRDSTPIDVVTNSTGAAIGVLLAVLLVGVGRLRARRAARQPVRQQ